MGYDVVTDGNSMQTKTLLKQKADPNETGEFGHTVLAQAADHNFRGVMKALIEYRAEVNRKGTGQGSAAPIHYSAGRGYAEAVCDLLKAKADPEIGEDSQMTPLHIAAMNGHVEAVEELLEGGAKRDSKDSDRRTPFDYASMKGY